MNNKHTLECTKNYIKFETNENNRPIHENPVLFASMQKNGFMPSSPIHCIKNGYKLKVLRGHHRLHFAKQLGLPVYYVVDNSVVDIFKLEGSTIGTWSVEDFLFARANDGDSDCIKVIDFMKRYGLNVGAAASLVGGESAGSGNKAKEIKQGSFKIGDMKHANDVVKITDLCREIGLSFAVNSGFVAAVSLALQVPEVDKNILETQIRRYYHLMQKRSGRMEYLEEVESVYNHMAKSKRIPLKFRALEEARKRAMINKK